MADEPRRSGRATKGQHTKDRDAPEEATTTVKGKKGKGRKSEIDEADKPGPDGVLCICGAKEDEEGLKMICCESCENWSHNVCMGVTEDDEELQHLDFYCERCRPDLYPELVAGKQNGEQPWEERKEQRLSEVNAAEKNKKGRRGKGGRPSKAGNASPAPADTKATLQVKTATGIKRKHAEDSDYLTPAEESRPNSPAVEADDLQAQQKRRKSSHPPATTPLTERKPTLAQRKSSASGGTMLSELQGEAQRKKVREALAKDIEPIIKGAVKDKWFRVPDGHTPSSLSQQIGTNIEEALARELEGMPYTEQFKRLHANIRSNHKLFGGLLTGKLQASELASMTSEDMATEEKLEEAARLKAKANKQSILVRDDGPRMRKTHKGEEMVGDEGTVRHTEDNFKPVRHRPAEEVENGGVDNEPEPVEAPEIPEDSSRRPLSVDTTSQAQEPGVARQSSGAQFDINQVWSSVQSPNADGAKRQTPQGPRRTSSIHQTNQNNGSNSSNVVDADVDRLLKDDDPTEGFVPEPQDTNVAWEGTIRMSHVGELRASARRAAGALIPPKYSWKQLLPSTIIVTGRIGPEITNAYIENTRATPYTEVSVVVFSPGAAASDHTAFNDIFNYFITRGKWGVLDTSHHEAVKDMYLFPLEADSPFPAFLSKLVDNEVPSQRNGRTMLAVMVVKTVSPVSSAQPTPQPATAAARSSRVVPAPSNGTPAAQPQFSPVVPQEPDVVKIPPRAAEILGDFIRTPTVMMMMANIPEMSELQLTNLREVLETAPETQRDIAELSTHLMRRNGTDMNA